MQCDRGYAAVTIHELGKDGRKEETAGTLAHEKE